MSNSISFTGRLGKDAELKEVGENKVLNFSVASDVGYGDKKTTNWFDCAVWGKRGDALASMLKKGKQVSIFGEFKARKWEKGDKSGTALEVRVDRLDLCGSKEESESEAF